MSPVSIVLVDYGMGNIRSVEKALERTGASVTVTDDPDALTDADGVVVPGVGAFPKAAENLERLGLGEALANLVSTGVPMLGICLGLQLLFDRSAEGRTSKGMGLMPGSVERIGGGGVKVPHIGWSPVAFTRPSRLTEGLPDRCPFYFVHSFAAVPANLEDVLGTAEYGGSIVCAVERGSIYGVQFHPEKSSTAGLKLLDNFRAICADGR